MFEFDTPALDRMRRVLELVPTDLGQHLERTHADTVRTCKLPNELFAYGSL